MRANEDGTRWGLASQVAGALFLWSFYEVPVDPAGESGLADPLVVVLTACLPLGLVVAALMARFGRRNGTPGALSWVVAFGYGVWLGGWTWIVGTSAGILECEPPACRSAWGPRIVTFVAALAVVGVCARAEAALRKRWASAPS